MAIPLNYLQSQQNTILLILLILQFTLQTIIPIPSFAQNKKIDSLKTALNIAPNDSNKVSLLNELCREYRHFNPATAIQYSRQAITLSEQIGFKKGIANSLQNIGIVYSYQGDYVKMLDYYLQSLKVYEELKYKKGIAGSFIGIGGVYWYQGDYENAIDYYLQSLKIYKELGYKKGIASSLSGVGIVYDSQGKTEKALEYYMKSLEMYKELGDKKEIGRSLNNIGSLYYVQRDIDKALQFYLASLRIREELKDNSGTASSLNNIGELYSLQGNDQKALEYINKSLSIAKGIGDKDNIQQSYVSLAEIFAKQINFKDAYKYHELYSDVKDSLLNVEKSKEIGKLEARYEYEKQKQKEESEAATLAKKLEEEQFRQNLVEHFIIIFIIMLLVVGLFSLQRNIPPPVLRFIIFFTTILLFEFLLVLLDPTIISYTAGAPLWTMLINATIASILFLPQKFLQHKLGTKQQVATTNPSNNIPNTSLKILLLLTLSTVHYYYPLNTIAFNFSTTDTTNQLNSESQQIKKPQDKIDSLKTILQTIEEDTMKVSILNRLASDLRVNEPEKALSFAMQALVSAEKLQFIKGITNSCYHIGVVNYSQGNYDKAFEYLLKSLKYNEKIKDKMGISNSYTVIGMVYRAQGDYSRAIDFNFRALKINEELGNQEEISSSLNNIGVVYHLQRNYDQAIDYYLRSLSIKDKLGNKKGIAASLGNIASIYFEQAVSGQYPDSTDSYYAKGHEYTLKALELNEDVGDKTNIAISLNNLGEYYALTGDHQKATEYLGRSLNVAKEIGRKYGIMATSKTLAEINIQLNNYQLAYHYHQQYSNYKDSLFNEKKSKEIGKLEAKHEYEITEIKREQELEEVRRRKSEVRVRRDKLQYGGIVLGFFALIGIILLLSRFVLPSWAIEFLTFVPFLLLFETILVYLDPHIESTTGGGPIYTVIANTLLALILYPTHNIMEKTLKKFFHKKKHKQP